MQIYDEKRKQIDRAVDLQLREWKSAQYYNAGMFAGAVDKIYMSSALANPVNDFKNSSKSILKREIPQLVVPEFDNVSSSL